MSYCKVHPSVYALHWCVVPVGLEQAPRQQHGGTESRMQKKFHLEASLLSSFLLAWQDCSQISVFMLGFLWISCLYLFWAESLCICVYLYVYVAYITPSVHYFVVYLFFPLRLLLD